jgi:hypothetical protein
MRKLLKKPQINLNLPGPARFWGNYPLHYTKRNQKIQSDISRSAQGIEAEILFCRDAVKKIGAESPVSGRGAAGNAPKNTIPPNSH